VTVIDERKGRSALAPAANRVGPRKVMSVNHTGCGLEGKGLGGDDTRGLEGATWRGKRMRHASVHTREKGRSHVQLVVGGVVAHPSDMHRASE
jgi:hypothetical protein